MQLGNLMYSCFTAKCFAYSLLSPQLNNNNRASSETGGVYLLIYISSGRRLPSITSNSLENHFSSPIFFQTAQGHDQTKSPCLLSMLDFLCITGQMDIAPPTAAQLRYGKMIACLSSAAHVFILVHKGFNTNESGNPSFEHEQ